jgi:hypothetical protein
MRSTHIVHGVTAGALGFELAIALLAATGLSGLLAGLSRAAALAVAALCLVFFLPALAAAALLGAVSGTAGLIVAMMPLLAWAWLRLPAGQWRTARALNGSVVRVVRVLVAPVLAPFLCAALLLGVAVLGLRWRLESHPAPLVLPDPVTATG